MKLGKRVLTWLLLTALLLPVGCSTSTSSSGSAPDSSNLLSSIQTGGNGQLKQNSAVGTPENDTSIGLKNIKIDSTDSNLTDEQRTVLNYFDNDYFYYPSYEFLRRYPMIFESAQIYIWGSVKKIISLDTNTVQMVLSMYQYDDWYTEAGENEYLLLTGPVGSISYMEGDYLSVYGRCNGLEMIDIDGISYTVPKVNIHTAYINGDKVVDTATIKQIASTLFGNDFEIRKPVMGSDITGANIELYFPGSFDGYDEPSCMLVELEDQSNAKLSNFLFGIYDGWIRPYKDGSDDYVIERSLEFAPDFSHFFLFTLDKDQGTLTLEYYDQERNKIWKREFTGVTTTCYDYTVNNIYFSVNNELYIINTETGEDTFPPAYVGAKVALRKLNDGILMISESQSDAIMKCGLDGSILWKTDLSGNVSAQTNTLFDSPYIFSIQLLGDNIILSLNLYHEYDPNTGTYSSTHYIALDPDTGEILQDAIELQ